MTDRVYPGGYVTHGGAISNRVVTACQDTRRLQVQRVRCDGGRVVDNGIIYSAIVEKAEAIQSLIGRIEDVDRNVSSVNGHHCEVVLHCKNVSRKSRTTIARVFAPQGGSDRSGDHLVCSVMKGAVIQVFVPGKQNRGIGIGGTA